MENEIVNLNNLAGGAIQEAINFGLEEVFENILDPNTEAEKARKLTIVIDIKPDETRQILKTKITCKPTLVPANSITTQMLLGREGDKIVANELTKNNPNQMNFDDLEKENEKGDNDNVIPLEREVR